VIASCLIVLWRALSEFHPSFHGSHRSVTYVILFRAFVSGSKALSAGPPGPRRSFQDPIYVALRYRAFEPGLPRYRAEAPSTSDTECRSDAASRSRTSSSEAEGLRHRCYLPVAQPSGSDDHAANGRPAQHPTAPRGGLRHATATSFSAPRRGSPSRCRGTNEPARNRVPQEQGWRGVLP